jgi:hypothetical protein
VIARRRFAPALAVLVTAGAALGSARVLCADEPAVPADAVPHVGMPPFLPAEAARADPEALEAWAARMAEAGRRAGATRRGAELLYSAAAAMPTATGRQIDAARRVFHEVHLQVPEDDPLGALGNLEVLRLSLALGHFEHAKVTGAWLERWERTNAPVDADAVTAQRFALLRARMATTFQVDVATLLEGLGNLGGAALRLERLAEKNPPGLLQRLPSLWERAAILRFRAGRTAEARADVARALAAEPTPEERAQLLFWLLHLKHGLLSAEGVLRPTGVWPGAAYLEDLHATLRELAGNPHLGEHLLSAASSALVARADEDAFALYGLALDDPTLRARARTDLGVVGGLLPAVQVALRLERFEQGERWLDDIESLAGVPVAEAEALRVRLKLAREAAAAREAARERPPPAGPGSGEPGPRRAPELRAPAPAEESRREGARTADDGADRATPAWWWLGGVLGLALLVGLIWKARR